MLHEAMSRNYNRLDGVLATLQRETRKGRQR
jgi:hypothetical protein